MTDKIKTIKFTRQELKWIERTADIESAMAMHKFTQLVQFDVTKLNKKEVEMIKNISTELIELYLFLKELRTKLELWDCRYDIDTEINFPDKDVK
jgi:hypothetical protein